jgi:hypothetical protein
MDGWNGFFVQRQLIKVGFRAVASYLPLSPPLSLSSSHVMYTCTHWTSSVAVVTIPSPGRATLGVR